MTVSLMRVYCALFILIPVSCATGEGIWCRNNCAEIQSVLLVIGDVSLMDKNLKDLQLFDDCKVEMCADKETCNTIQVYTRAESSKGGMVITVDTTSCGTRKHGETVPGQECKDKGVFAAFQKASQENKISFTLKKESFTMCQGENSVCKENCVPAELLPQDKEKEKFEKSSAASPTLGAVLVAGTVVLLH